MTYNYTLPLNRIVNDAIDDCNGDKGRALFSFACDIKDLKDEIKSLERSNDNRMSDLSYLIRIIGRLPKDSNSGYNAINLIDSLEELIIDVDGTNSEMVGILDNLKESLIQTVRDREKQEQKYGRWS